MISLPRSTQNFFLQILSLEGNDSLSMPHTLGLYITFHFICRQQSFVLFLQPIVCRFPYFLPCLCISVFVFGVTIVCIWLPVRRPNFQHLLFRVLIIFFFPILEPVFLCRKRCIHVMKTPVYLTIWQPPQMLLA